MRGTLLVFTQPGAPARRFELSLPRVLGVALLALCVTAALGWAGWNLGDLMAHATL